MKKDTRDATPIRSSFLQCEKDTETILRKLFVESQPHSEDLKKLLVINTEDCLDNKDSEIIKEKMKETSLASMMKDGYINLTPKIKIEEHSEVKSYLILSFDDFSSNATNPYYRDTTIIIDILCHADYWALGNYRLRPLKIAGIIDGILNKSKLSGIGTLEFLGSSELILNNSLSGYVLMYRAVHGNDDKLESE